GPDTVTCVSRGAHMAIVSLLLAALLGACSASGGPDPSRPKEIEQTFPNPGDTIIAQGEVGADVPQAWSFRLTIDGIVIPDDQLSKVPELGIFKFMPRPGRIIERF